jgi:WD40 repeat protein
LHYFSVDESTAQIALPLRGVDSACTAIALAPDGAVCVTGHQDGTVAFWETRAGRLLSAAWQAHRGVTAPNTWEVLHLRFSEDGQTLVSTGFHVLLVKIWSVARRRELASRYFVTRYDPVPAIAPDGREIAIGGPGQGLTVNFWTADLKTSPRQFEGHQDYLHAIAYSPDGRTLATGGLDGLLKLWHLPTGREFGTLATFDHLVGFRELAFSPDGSWLGALVRDGTLHLWHAPTLAETDGPP